MSIFRKRRLFLSSRELGYCFALDCYKCHAAKAEPPELKIWLKGVLLIFPCDTKATAQSLADILTREIKMLSE